MSFYKDQLKKHLASIDLKAESVLSIGSEHDDRKYFKSVDVKNWMTLDCEEQFKPDLLLNMNKPFIEDDDAGDFYLLEKFDAILAFELWEYIYDPMTAHKNIFGMLKPGGTYMGSYPFIYPHHNPVSMDALRYTDSGIKKLLTHSGFTKIEIKERVATAGRGHLNNFIGAEGMRLSKELAGNYSFPIGYIVTAKK